MRFLCIAGALGVAMLLGGGPADAAPGPAKTILTGLARAVKAGHMPADEAAVDRQIAGRAAGLWPRLPASRGNALKDVLDDVAAQAPRYNRPRALALFGTLLENTHYLALHALSGQVHQDVTDANGVVYRYFPGHGFQFHPLANFAALNAAVSAKDEGATRRLADALIARGLGSGGGGLVWEYYFGFGGGRAPWTSGMAQAVAAQSFARASSLLGDPGLAYAARRAERAIPGRLLRTTSFGPWVRLYSFSDTVVLNAQLQTAISLAAYAQLTDDSSVAALAASLRTAAAAGLASFDTGYWSLYALPAEDSTLSYHEYVISLLRILGRDDPRFASAASRFDAYTRQPPAFELGDSGGDGVLFWLSKPSRLTISVGDAAHVLSLRAGWHRVSWPVGTKPGSFWAHLSATDYAGNHAEADALPVVRVALARGKRAPLAAPALAQPSFAVGVGLDDITQAHAAAAAGFATFRVAVPWAPGETEPPPETVAGLNAVTSGRRVVQLAYDAPDPSLAPFAASLVQQVPRLDDLIVGAPGQPAASYEETLAAVRDAVRATGSTVRIAGTVSSTASIASLGAELRSSGRTKPIMDELAFRATAPPDSRKVVAALGAAFGGTAQAGSALPILWDGVGTATKIPRAKAPLYAPDAAAAPGATDQVQAAVSAAVLKQAACTPTGAGVLFDRFADGPALGQQDGVLYPDGTAKPGLPLLAPSLTLARRGTIAVCPGLAARVATTTLEFPKQAVLPKATRSWSVRVGCSRDCLYLVTLDRASTGVPMLARRGSLVAGRAAATVTLPRLPVPAGTYRFTVRLVARVNPGPLFVQRGPVLTVSR